MKQYASTVLCSTLFILFIFFFTHTAFAHPGSGPPFLKINGIYADTDPYSSLREDIVPTIFTPSETITFEIDTARLGIPEDIVNTSDFRWTFDRTDDVTYGISIAKRFVSLGSHVITLEVKAPNDPGFFTLDTIRIHIARSLTYKIPQVKVGIITSDDISDSPVTFEPYITADPTAKAASYVWTLGDGTIQSNKIAQHSFIGSNYAYLVSVKVTDTNGYINYGGVVVSAVDSKRVFDDPFTAGKSFVRVNPTNTPHTSKAIPYSTIFLVIVSILLLPIIAFTIFMRRKKKK